MPPFLFLFLLLFFSLSFGLIITHTNGTIVDLYSLHSTLGSTDTRSIPYPIAFMRKKEATLCANTFVTQLSPLLASRFIVYLDDIFEEELFDKCTNHFFDSYANPVYFAQLAQQVGAVGVMSIGSRHEGYSDYRVAGVNNKIKIPYFIMNNQTLQYFLQYESEIALLTPPVVSDGDISTINLIVRLYQGLSLVSCIFWPLLAVLTAYCAYIDIRTYFSTPKNSRRIHPTLSKVMPCFSAIFASLFHLVDPFSYNVVHKFPASFFFIMHLGVLIITVLLLLKTWILAVGGLRSPKIFRVSLIGVNVYIVLVIIVIIVWICEDTLFLIGTIGGCVTTLVCAAGFIYFGRDVLLILSGGDGASNATYKNLSMKVVIFMIVFVVFGVASVVIYALEVMGSVLSSLFVEAFMAIGLFITYAVLFLRKTQAPAMHSPHGPPSTGVTSAYPEDKQSQEKLSQEKQSQEKHSQEKQSQEKSQDSSQEKSYHSLELSDLKDSPQMSESSDLNTSTHVLLADSSPV